MRRAARADANQPEIVKVFRKLGGTFQHTHSIPGALDGILGYCGVDVRIEIKDGSRIPSERKLTTAEQKTVDEWNGRKPEIIESVSDAALLMERMRKQREKLQWD